MSADAVSLAPARGQTDGDVTAASAAPQTEAIATLQTKASTAPQPEASAPSQQKASAPWSQAKMAPLPHDPIWVDGKWAIREISMGRVPTPSALEGRPGYYPPDDPEFDAVLRGRREVDQIDVPLEGGMPTAESLARAILKAVETADAQQLVRLRITFDEFSQILWPEFPQSRPATHAKAQDGWGFLHGECAEGISRGLQDWGGMKLEFQALSFSIGLGRYTNFSLYQGVQINVVTPAGAAAVVDFAHTFVEKEGVWKIYIYKD